MIDDDIRQYLTFIFESDKREKEEELTNVN